MNICLEPSLPTINKEKYYTSDEYLERIFTHFKTEGIQRLLKNLPKNKDLVYSLETTVDEIVMFSCYVRELKPFEEINPRQDASNKGKVWLIQALGIFYKLDNVFSSSPALTFSVNLRKPVFITTFKLEKETKK